MVLPDVFFTLLVNRRIHKKRGDGGGRAIDGHRYRGARITKIEAGVQFFGIVQTTNAHPRIANFPINIGSIIGVFAVQGH